MAHAHSFHVTWYATGLRGDDMEAAIGQVAAIAPRYGATHYAVYRSGEDLYKFLMITDFPNKDDFQKYWYGEEAREMRAAMSGAFQNPVVYVPQTLVAEGSAVPTSV